jgi:hypothetical protein
VKLPRQAVAEQLELTLRAKFISHMYGYLVVFVLSYTSHIDLQTRIPYRHCICIVPFNFCNMVWAHCLPVYDFIGRYYIILLFQFKCRVGFNCRSSRTVKCLGYTSAATATRSAQAAWL